MLGIFANLVHERDRRDVQATAYGGTVISCDFRPLYPSPAVILGVKRERLENGVEMPKYTYSSISMNISVRGEG
jgi:hypothetical protein